MGRRAPAQFQALTVFRAERRRGLVHRPEYVERMAELEADYQAWLAVNQSRESRGNRS